MVVFVKLLAITITSLIWSLFQLSSKNVEDFETEI